jgi:hypothetical protein
LATSDFLYIGIALYVAEPGFECFTLSASRSDLFFQPSSLAFDAINRRCAACKVNYEENRNSNDDNSNELGEGELGSAFLFQWLPVLDLDRQLTPQVPGLSRTLPPTKKLYVVLLLYTIFDIMSTVLTLF